MSYVCDCCGRECEHLATRSECREFWGHGACEIIYCCPYCGGSVSEVEAEADDMQGDFAGDT